MASEIHASQVTCNAMAETCFHAGGVSRFRMPMMHALAISSNGTNIAPFPCRSKPSESSHHHMPQYNEVHLLKNRTVINYTCIAGIRAVLSCTSTQALEGCVYTMW